MIRLVTLCCLLPFSASALLQSTTTEKPPRPEFTATRIDRPVRLTGLLDDPLWETARPVELPYEFQPGENVPAPVRTLAYALFDQEHLYLGFRCFDPEPRKIRANLSDRDRIFGDDYVIVVFDPYGDFQRGYELAVNPYGIQGDLMASGGNEDMSFDMIWRSAASITADGWVAEMAVPFKSLRFPDREVHEWVFSIVRNYPRDSRRMMSWTPVDRNIPNFMSQGGLLKGLKDIHSSGAIELLPYMLGEQAGIRSNRSDPSSRFDNGDLRGRFGTGLRYAPSSDLSVDMVLNPDFSQVESDADQISVNTTFALYYPERRPFFLESADLLQTPMYYSRSINNPLGAGRVVGKTGGLTYMYLGAYDRNTVFVVPGEEQSNTVLTDRTSFANIGRARYNFANEAYVGGMLFTRHLSGGDNMLLGFDWNYKFWENWYFNGEGFLTRTKELTDPSLLTSTRTFGTTGRTAALDGESYTGSGIHVVLSKSGRNLGFTAVYNDFSPTYQTYNGLFSSNNFRQFYFSPRYTVYFTDSFVERIRFSASSEMQFNYAGAEKRRFLQPSVSVSMKGQSYVFIGYRAVSDELFRNVQFRNVRRISFESGTRAWDFLAVNVYGETGRFVYRSGVPRTGEGHNLGTSVTIRPTAQLKIDLSYNRARLSDASSGSLFYDGYVARTVGIYQFTPELFVRSIFQYNSFGKTFNVYPLVSYKLNALTTFYAGLTNNYLDYGTDRGFATTDRQFFLKLQYLFRT